MPRFSFCDLKGYLLLPFFAVFRHLRLCASSICKTNGTQENYITAKNSKITHRLALGAIRDSLVVSCSAGF